VLYTITSKAGIAAEQGQQAVKTTTIITSEGATVFEAVRNMLQYAHKRPHYGHTEFILFGEDTAKDGILPYLDFISRNQEFRYNAKIYIVRELTANSFLEKLNSGDLYLADRLSIIEDNSNKLSKSGRVTLAEALFVFSKENVSTFLPVISIAPTKAGESPSEGKYDMILKDYAIFDQDKLFAFLDDELSMGVNWVKNRILSGVILVDAPDKKKVAMEIIQSKTSIKPYIDENGLQCTISIKFNTNIAETMSTEKIFTIESIDILKQLQEMQVKKDVENILNYAQEKDMDIFGLVSNFVMKYPMMKNELRANWRELFSEIKFKVEVDSNINTTYVIKESATSK
jgi:spore germination protein KC